MIPPPPMPGVMRPQQTRAPGMPGLSPQRNAPPAPGLKKPPQAPKLKSPAPVSNSPAQKPPHAQSKPSKSPGSAPKPSPKAASFSRANYDFLNTAGPNDQPGAMPSSAPMMPSAAPPLPSPAPQQQGLPSVGDMEPDWGGHGTGSGSHISDEGPNWQGSNPDMFDTDPLHSLSRRKGIMFSRVRLCR